MKFSDLKIRMEELEHRAKRSLGQNFLISEPVIERIIDAVRTAEPSYVVEIGPGLGSLTEHLTDWNPLLIELDRDLAHYWCGRGFSVIEDDALKVSWEKLSLPENTWLVSNLPYQISTHLLVDRCFGPLRLRGMVLMFQKEVAQRMTAAIRTSAYGLLSAMAQNFWNISKVSDASTRDFHPAPKVASRVLKFVRKPNVDLDAGFLRFLKAAFAQRRKFLLKNLKQLGHKREFTFEEAMERLCISPKARAEELTPDQFAQLYRNWKTQR